MDEHPEKSPLIILRDWWNRRPQLELTSVDWLTGKMRDLHEAGYTRDQLLDMLRDLELDLEDGKLTQQTDNALRIIAELRAAEEEVRSFDEPEMNAEAAESKPEPDSEFPAPSRHGDCGGG